MGDIVIGPSVPQLPPQETVAGNPSATTQKPADNSISDAKGIGLDLGKSLGSGLFDYWIKKDHSLSFSLEHALQDATKDLGKTAINVFTKQLASDPQSPLRFLLSESGEGYFYPAQHDLFSRPTDNDPNLNGGKPESKDNKPKGFDVSVGFPKLNLTPNGSFLDLALKPSPAHIKEFSIGDKIKLSYGTTMFDFKLGVEAEGSLGFHDANHWSSLNRNLLEKQGQGSVTPSVGLNVHPNENFRLSIEAGTQLSSKLTGPDNHRANTLETHLGFQLMINLPGGTDPKKEELLRKENPPKEDTLSGRDADAVMRFVDERFKIELPAPEPSKPVNP
jgi:hypothetical protein